MELFLKLHLRMKEHTAPSREKPTQTRELMNNATSASYIQYHIIDTVNVKDALDFSKK